DYERIGAMGRALRDKALKAISANIATDRDTLVVFNQLGIARSDLVEFELPEGYADDVSVMDSQGNVYPVQINGNTGVFYAANIPARGYRCFSLTYTKAADTPNDLYVDKNLISNPYYTIMLDDNANIVSIYDKKAGREVLQPGGVARLIAFEDKPLAYDAWDINIYYQHKSWNVDDVRSVQVVETGPVRGVLRVTRAFCDSEIITDICVYQDNPRIDFKTRIDWKEKQVLLKAAFPVDVHAEKAVYEIQYGNVERPTHWNTSWDYAKFEVCAHKWADLSEDGYGVSLLNDCKYGHDIKDGVMRLTLLKSAAWPNVNADREVHEFTYSLYPHAGSWRDSGTVQEAYKLNNPVIAVYEKAHPGGLAKEFSLVWLDKENVVIEAVKKAEDSGDIIVRLYECYNRRARVKLTFCQPILQAWECDMLENEEIGMDIDGNSFEFEIKPYEIKTFKIKAR
ncbi:MAG TPA: glycoside hydrolase family 38 C-terminal domain-containing protein, partial [Clostridia bacterium]|nr:glycoside hydrolase family 38 C-terminal domain-containing protein [Clostridia bacterium]